MIESSDTVLDSVQLQKLHQQLQKSFKIIQQSLKEWKESLSNCEPELASLQNLFDQYTCCKEAPSELIPVVAVLLDVKEKLLYKVTTEINNKLEKIQNEMQTLKQICDKVTKQYDYSMGLYEKSTNMISINDVTDKTPTRPSVAQMLEFVHDAEELLVEQYNYNKYLLDNLNLNDESTQDRLMKVWDNGGQSMIGQIEENLCYVAGFLEEKL